MTAALSRRTFLQQASATALALGGGLRPSSAQAPITQVFYDPATLRHAPAGDHPENPKRLDAAMNSVRALEQKGRLKKEDSERAYVYRPAEPQAKVVGTMVTDFIKRMFNGSATPLLVHLAESREIRQEHLDEISKLLKTKRGRK